MASACDLRKRTWVVKISEAILSSPNEKMLGSDIHNCIQLKYPTDYTEENSRSWKASIRTTLRGERCFQIVGNDPDYLRSFWGLHPAIATDFRNGKYRTRDQTIDDYDSAKQTEQQWQKFVTQDSSVPQGLSYSIFGTPQVTGSAQRYVCASSPNEGLIQDPRSFSGHPQPSYPAQSGPHAATPSPGGPTQDTHAGLPQPSWLDLSGPYSYLSSTAEPTQDPPRHIGHPEHYCPVQSSSYASCPSTVPTHDPGMHIGHLQPSYPAQSIPYASTPLTGGPTPDTESHAGVPQPSWHVLSSPYSFISSTGGPTQDPARHIGHPEHSCPPLSGPYAFSPSGGFTQDTTNHSGHLQPSWPAQSDPFAHSPSGRLAHNPTSGSGNPLPSLPAQSRPPGGNGQ